MKKFSSIFGLVAFVGVVAAIAGAATFSGSKVLQIPSLTSAASSTGCGPCCESMVVAAKSACCEGGDGECSEGKVVTVAAKSECCEGKDGECCAGKDGECCKDAESTVATESTGSTESSGDSETE